MKKALCILTLLLLGNESLLWAYKNTPLIHWTHKKNVLMVTNILAQGVDINHKEHGKTALIVASEDGNPAMIELLLSYKPNLEITDTSLETALMKAVMYGHVEAVRLLLDAGANPNTTRANGHTALQLAMTIHKKHKSAIIELLKNKNARYTNPTGELR